ncbi:MAG: hypothetical protein AB7G93_14560 [Bdellovibrionales bacterium]
MRRQVFSLLIGAGVIVEVAFGSFAHAGIIIGNGAGVVVCSHPAPPELVKQPRLSDFFEAEYVLKIKLAEPEGATEKEQFHGLMRRIQKRFPVLHDEIMREFKTFEERSEGVGFPLGKVTNSFPFVIPDGCEEKYVVIQRPAMSPLHPLFLIDEKLKAELPLFDRAGVPLHESLYKIGLRNGLEHAIGLRYLVALMASENIYNWSDYHWIWGFRHTRIKHYEVDGLRFPLFQGSGSCDPSPGTIECRDPVLPVMARISYTTNGTLESISYDKGPEWVEIRSFGELVKIQTDEVRFRDLGAEEMAVSLKGNMVINSSVAPTAPSSPIYFSGTIYPKGRRLCGERTPLEGSDLTRKGSVSGCVDLWELLSYSGLD